MNNTDLDLEARIDAGQIAIAESPGGPGTPSLLGQHLAGTINGIVYLIGEQISAVDATTVAREATRWLAPVAIVDLE